MKSLVMKLREFKDSDAQAVADLSNANSKVFQYSSVTPDFLTRMSKNARYDMFVIEEARKIVGFCGINHARWPVAEIGPICVRADNRERGLGKTLLQKAISLAREFNNLNVIIKVKASNKRAQEFFKSMGFKKTQDIKVHGDPAILMEHELE